MAGRRVRAPLRCATQARMPADHPTTGFRTPSAHAQANCVRAGVGTRPHTSTALGRCRGSRSRIDRRAGLNRLETERCRPPCELLIAAGRPSRGMSLPRGENGECTSQGLLGPIGRRFLEDRAALCRGEHVAHPVAVGEIGGEGAGGPCETAKGGE